MAAGRGCGAGVGCGGGLGRGGIPGGRPAVRQGEPRPRMVGRGNGMIGTPGVAIDYVALVEDTTLRRPDRAIAGNVLAVAVKLGSIRLIDNVVLGAERL